MSDHETDQNAAPNEEPNNEVNVPKPSVNLPQGFTPLVPRPPIPGGKPPVPGQRSDEPELAGDDSSDSKPEMAAEEVEVPTEEVEVEEVAVESEVIEAEGDDPGTGEDDLEAPVEEMMEITAEDAPDLLSGNDDEEDEPSGEESPDEEVVSVEEVTTVVEEEETIPDDGTEDGEPEFADAEDEAEKPDASLEAGEVDLTGPDVESIFAKVTDEAEAVEDELEDAKVEEVGELEVEDATVSSETEEVEEVEAEESEIDDEETPEVIEEVIEEKTVEVTFRAPKVQPVRLSAAAVYPVSQDDEESGEAEETVAAEGEEVAGEDKSILEKLADGELEEFGSEPDEDDESEEDEDEDESEDSLDEDESEESTEGDAEDDDSEEDEDESSSGGEEQKEPTQVPDVAAVAELVSKARKSDAEKMEVMDPDAEKTKELFRPEKSGSRWAFWRRSSKRDQQLARISEGYLDMVDLVRAIRGQLESQNENNLILRDSLSHLPEAMKGLDSFSKSQRTVGKALKEIHGQLKKSGTKDQKLVESMGGFNDTLKGMDDTSKATMKTFDRVQERMRDSDIRMENLFQNVQNTEEKVGETMVRLQRNMAIMQSLFLICLMIVIGVLVFTVMGNWDQGESKDPALIERAEKKEGETPPEN